MNDIDFDRCQIRINHGKGNKDQMVPFPDTFKETLILFIHSELANGTLYLFESNRKKPFTTRGVRKILAEYATEAGMRPHKLRYFLFTWLKKQGIDDALIQPYSSHETRKSLEIIASRCTRDI